MTDLDRYTELIKSIQSGYPTNKDCKPQKELDSLKSKIEHDLSQHYYISNVFIDLEIPTPYDLWLSQSKELEQQNKELQEKAELDHKLSMEDITNVVNMENEIKQLKDSNEKLGNVLMKRTNECDNLKDTIEKNEVYKTRYEGLQDRYLNWNEKHFGELCGLYFDDEILRGKEE